MQTESLPDAQSVADAVGREMYARDQAAQALGIVLDAIAPGRARMSMTVRPDMLNGHSLCHGGMIFTLADTAFAYACNSRNATTVAQAAQITFVAAALAGERLTAEAVRQAGSSRTGVYDVTVSNAAGQVVALFRGNSFRLKGEVVAGLKVQE